MSFRDAFYGLEEDDIGGARKRDRRNRQSILNEAQEDAEEFKRWKKHRDSSENKEDKPAGKSRHRTIRVWSWRRGGAVRGPGERPSSREGDKGGDRIAPNEDPVKP